MDDPVTIREHLVVGPQTTGTLAEAASREWLVADGLGGYAMGTVAGLRTRRYHGLLVVPREHPGARDVGLAALEPMLVLGDARIRLATDEWAGGAVDPAGHVHLQTFDLEDGVPRWRWSVGGVVLEREVAMQHGRSLVAVTHRLIAADRPVRLELVPLCTWRDQHGDRRANGAPQIEPVDGGFVFEGRYRVAGAGWTGGGEWYRGAYLRAEAERGLGPTEDLWAAGSFAVELAPGESLDVVAYAGALHDAPPAAGELVRAARRRSRGLVETAGAVDEIDRQLVLAADQLVIATASGPTTIAGYPWFGEWSRDTMTSYEGLLLETGRAEEGRALLLRAAATLSEGMLANTADAGGLEYNTADGTLWLVHAVGRHVERTGDQDLAAALAGDLQSVIEHHVAGTRFGIRCDADGLVTQGADGWALTWMDARVDGRPVTQRAGKAVDINALWIAALGTVAQLQASAGGDASRWSALRDRAVQSFGQRFVRADGLGLYDVVDGPGGDDASIRPNQLLALSLPNGPGAPPSTVQVCRQHLLTSLGLRSLAPGDPAYRGRHRGGPAERDAAYHQGTVWPWLVGPFVSAALAVGASVEGVLGGLEAHVAEAGLGSVSETADGDAPHGTTGCPFQGWSVAELLRARRLLRPGGAPA